MKRTTGGNEGYHSGTKKSIYGLKSSDNIGQSYKKISYLQTTAELNLSKKCSQHNSAQYGKATDIQERPVGLSEYINDKLSYQNKDSKNYLIFCYDDGKYYVKRNYDLLDNTVHEDIDNDVDFAKYFLQTSVDTMDELPNRERGVVIDIRDCLLGNKKGAFP